MQDAPQPGTPLARLEYILKELANLVGCEHPSLAAAPPEAWMLQELRGRLDRLRSLNQATAEDFFEVKAHLAVWRAHQKTINDQRWLPSDQIMGWLEKLLAEVGRLRVEAKLQKVQLPAPAEASGGGSAVRSTVRVETFEGKVVDPLDPRPEDISLTEIAHVLSMHPRFMGHCAWHYSIAQHALLCSLVAPPELAAAALLWNAPAIYIGEPFRPMAPHIIYDLSDFRGMHYAVARVLRRKVFGALEIGSPTPEQDEALGRVRLRALWTERRSLLLGKSEWDLEPAEPITKAEIPPAWAHFVYAVAYAGASDQLRRMAPEEAECAFLARAAELGISSKPEKVEDEI